ncbi:oligoribonuclease [Legionella hackeliae]|uniref:Oligoribonuclease n=1 Tax=Legionella hackeliae TaxID=449 RepID=A0A0A8UYD3_LEGHA|nr:oligoribonuclease [Legionella hackeliae]KTD09920.1 oligoribonuclease [Legionella hackeliae]CEK11779.1 oligoribonuclease [Legionella hackeliae]STX48550.1 putative ACR [Legionella hackeliae]
MKNNDNLIWIDLEMTGLDPEKDHIIEIATIVTDPHLTILGEGPVFAIHQEEALLAGMDDWNTKQHNQSGLVKRVRESSIDEAQAEQKTIEFLKKYVDKGKSPMCGNSICQDRRFLYKYMPELAAYFHYRNLDVSTLKELVKRWHPKLINGVTKESKHLALDDIKDSIIELEYYRQHFINIPSRES